MANENVLTSISSIGGKPVKIRWLGGEPTVAAHRIDQISKGLIDRGIDFISNITTNGYLFDGWYINGLYKDNKKVYHLLSSPGSAGFVPCFSCNPADAVSRVIPICFNALILNILP